ncbi:aldehyde dehydrogenase family protein [Streptosporangium sp. 'caverna']|uniref:aldehyde dehydrogenase family protein n=1 Tax=Streptosporangium sp. 'caverna' TaxID=2202249 RepID=UPI000D7D55BC|nr:aldehyde dehydrogenase family protein [Streptosporangium sp. 'caverna']AWS44275.1 benzaldehyde dehydrogenase [Streptosporangium sp. 'caverna']
MVSLLLPETLDGVISSGGWRRPGGGSADAVEPATGQVLAKVGLADPDDVRRATRLAAAAQRQWAAAGHRDRIRVLRDAAGLLRVHRDEFTEWLVRESGSTRGKAAFEIESVLDELYVAAGLPGQSPGHLLPPTPGRRSVAHRTPIGVVGVISPWNVPLVLSMRAVAPALALGNAVVLKPDPRTAVCGGLLIARLFEEAGLPDNVLHVLPGTAVAGAALVEDPAVGMIAFTGSTAVGRAIGERAGRALKRTSLELGGNNALLVLADADIATAAAIGAFSSFFHQGQVCMAAGRHIVLDAVADSYAELLTRRANEITVGDPWREEVSLGPLIDTGQLKRVSDIVAESVTGGARLLAGGTHRHLYYAPTVLDGVTPEMPAFREEIFGPVAPIVRVRDEEEAIEVANTDEHGLVAAIVTGAPERAESLADRLRVGIVHINDPIIEDDAYVPFGGLGASGNGSRHGALHHWDEFTEWRWITTRDTAVSPAF